MANTITTDVVTTEITLSKEINSFTYNLIMEVKDSTFLQFILINTDTEQVWETSPKKFATSSELSSFLAAVANSLSQFIPLRFSQWDTVIVNMATAPVLYHRFQGTLIADFPFTLSTDSLILTEAEIHAFKSVKASTSIESKTNKSPPYSTTLSESSSYPSISTQSNKFDSSLITPENDIPPLNPNDKILSQNLESSAPIPTTQSQNHIPNPLQFIKKSKIQTKPNLFYYGYYCEFLSENQILVVCRDGMFSSKCSAYVFNPSTLQQVLAKYPLGKCDNFRSMVVSPCKKYLFVAHKNSGTVSAFHVMTGEEICEITAGNKGTLHCVNISSCGKYLAIGTISGKISLFSFSTSLTHLSFVQLPSSMANCRCVTFSPCSKFIYGGYTSGKIGKFEITQSAPFKTKFLFYVDVIDGIESLCANDTSLYVGGRKLVEIHTKTGKSLITYLPKTTVAIKQILLSPKNIVVLTNNKCLFYEYGKSNPIHKLEMQCIHAFHVCFNSKGIMFSCGMDGILVRWEPLE